MSRKRVFNSIWIVATLVVSLGYFLISIAEPETYQNYHFTEVSLPSNPLKHFGEAKRFAKEIYKENRETFYCGCRYDKHGNIDLASCGYQIQEDKRRAHHIEWEHIVPVSVMAQNRDCWKKKLCCNKNGNCFKGRECCRKIDPEFASMEADLHNLVPEIGELNALRSNYRFGLLPHLSDGKFGNCKIKIDPELRRVEPQSNIRGMIARIYLHISAAYQIPLSDNQRQLYEAWNREYPPSLWEIERDHKISRIQGNHNSFVTNYLKSQRNIR